MSKRKFSFKLDLPVNTNSSPIGDKDPQLLNIATDLVLNQRLEVESNVIPDGALIPRDFGLPVDLSVEEYYDILISSPELINDLKK